MNTYFKRLTPYIAFYLILQTVIRLSLLVRALGDIDVTALDVFNIFLRGLWLDMAAGFFVLLPIAIIMAIIPYHWFERKTGRAAENLLRFAFAFILLFSAAAEHVFWTEFTTRFNFIAVDYLVYTQEVIGNIVESYPLAPIFMSLGALAAISTWMLGHFKTVSGEPEKARVRFLGLAVFALLAVLTHIASNVDQAAYSDNAEGSELASNGIYNLFHAFWNNEIDYDRFYAERSPEDIKKSAHILFEEDEATFDESGEAVRDFKRHGPELHKNVILVVMESMSADFMGAFGNQNGLTPNLDNIAQQGLFFTQAYATGTRTVRGLEAVTLSVPPTPGQSIVRRPGNDNLYSLGFVFKDRGYDTTFIYGGYGYFDNMNAFFAGNGFDTIDRTAFDKSEYDFANVWGITDDAVFARAVREADKSYAAKKPFMQLIMTTSNHRPYTFPEGRIDKPSGGGREAGVKYADYSIGELIKYAKDKPWFKDTVFVFVADHTAGAGGKAELAPIKYHIPMIFYAPDLIKPQRYEKLSSQIDVGPVLLGQLNFSYRSKFYGEDLLHDNDEVPHAFISNYQKVALVKNGLITVLAPKRRIDQFVWPSEDRVASPDKTLQEQTIAYYQSASWWRDTLKRIKTTLP